MEHNTSWCHARSCESKLSSCRTRRWHGQWRSEGNWRPGANVNFAPPPKKKIYIEMSSIKVIMCIIISA